MHKLKVKQFGCDTSLGVMITPGYDDLGDILNLLYRRLIEYELKKKAQDSDSDFFLDKVGLRILFRKDLRIPDTLRSERHNFHQLRISITSEGLYRIQKLFVTFSSLQIFKSKNETNLIT